VTLVVSVGILAEATDSQEDKGRIHAWRNSFGESFMASSARPSVQSSFVSTERSVARIDETHEEQPDGAQRAKRELLDDLMGDAKRHLATKSKAERKAIILAIGKIANS
jgi:hypothetical protein